MLQSLLDLSLLPNGDWSDRSCVEVFIPVDAEISEAELAENVASRMVRALAPKLYNVMSKDLNRCCQC